MFNRIAARVAATVTVTATTDFLLLLAVVAVVVVAVVVVVVAADIANTTDTAWVWVLRMFRPGSLMARTPLALGAPPR